MVTARHSAVIPHFCGGNIERLYQARDVGVRATHMIEKSFHIMSLGSLPFNDTLGSVGLEISQLPN